VPGGRAGCLRIRTVHPVSALASFASYAWHPCSPYVAGKPLATSIVPNVAFVCAVMHGHSNAPCGSTAVSSEA
jgi:hypothetical protein